VLLIIFFSTTFTLSSFLDLLCSSSFSSSSSSPSSPLIDVQEMSVLFLSLLYCCISASQFVKSQTYPLLSTLTAFPLYTVIFFFLLPLPFPLLSSFSSAFDQTGRIINITVAPLNNYDPPRLLNYLTAPHICVWSAACASCAVPGLFDSITLIVKGAYFLPVTSFRAFSLCFPSNSTKRNVLAQHSLPC
jgi:hypothetical protein